MEKEQKIEIIMPHGEIKRISPEGWRWVRKEKDQRINPRDQPMIIDIGKTETTTGGLIHRVPVVGDIVHRIKADR